MHKSVEDIYPQLWHYTTSQGLHGILTSQQLWATHISYLNDAEEFTGFFDRKLLQLINEGVQIGIKETGKTIEGSKFIATAGGQEAVEEKLPREMLHVLREATQKFQVYVTSFCSPLGEDSEDGLLSQWRGYGIDGGYAIIFETQGLKDLLFDEQCRYFYSYQSKGSASQ